ncbi:MAG: hypothetical protein ACKOFZ_01770 [Ilumatobacteraceae bacterium]
MSIGEYARRENLFGVLAIVISGLVVVLANRSGVSWSWDSTDYVAAGRSLAEFKGSLDVSGAPMTVRPPGYPFLISLGELLNAPTNITLLVINVASAIVTTGCVYVVVKRCAFVTTAVLAASFIALTPTMLWQTSMAWSEPPYVAVMMVAFVVVIWHTGRTRFIVLGCLYVALFFLRFVGPVFIAPLVVIGILVDKRTSRWAKAVGLHAITLGTSIIPMVWWLMRNRRIDGTLTGARQAGGGTFWETTTHAFGTYGSFLTGQPFDSVIYERVTDYPIAAQVAAVVVAGVLLASIAFASHDARLHQLAPSDRQIVVLASIGLVIAYTAFSAYRFVHLEIGRLDTRMMMPLLPALVVITSLTVERIVASRRSIARGVLVASIALTAIHSFVTLRDASRFGEDQRHLSNAVNRNLDLHVYVRSLGDDSALYSNAPQMLFLSADTWPIFTPWQVGTPWPGDCTRRYAVYYNDFQVQDNRPTTAQVLYEDPTGTVYDVGACSEDINLAWD